MLSTESNWKCSITAEQDKELWPWLPGLDPQKRFIYTRQSYQVPSKGYCRWRHRCCSCSCSLYFSFSDSWSCSCFFWFLWRWWRKSCSELDWENCSIVVNSSCWLLFAISVSCFYNYAYSTNLQMSMERAFVHGIAKLIAKLMALMALRTLMADSKQA